MNKEQIKRIRKMERSYNRACKVAAALRKDLEAMDKLGQKIAELEEYQRSGLWLQDFEADERGELPEDLRRGVLSEDGLYILLEDLSKFRK